MTNFIRTMCHSALDNVDVMLAVSTSVQKPSTVDTILISQGHAEETNKQTNRIQTHERLKRMLFIMTILFVALKKKGGWGVGAYSENSRVVFCPNK